VLKESISDSELKEELDDFLDFDDSHRDHFPGSAPSISEWERIRSYYAESRHVDPMSESTRPKHTRQISIYARGPHLMADDELDSLILKLNQMVPDADLHITHDRIK